MNEDKSYPQSEVLAKHLSYLPLLGLLAERMDELVNMGKVRAYKSHVEPNVSLSTDIPFKFDDVKSIYVDNVTNTQAVTIQFDNVPLYFSIPASSGRFLPCGGAKQFRITGTVASGSVNVMYANREMAYN